MQSFPLGVMDYLAFLLFFVALSIIGYLAGRKERASSDDYFLAGRSLPWYVVGTSFVASNISTEHFIGMIGAAFVYGICVAVSEWANVFTFSLIIWIFIPFLMASRVFTMPEFLERRYNGFLRQFFALVTVISNIVAFLAAVLYGGALALQTLFGWPLWVAIIALGIVSGIWAIYGGLSSVAWTDFFTVIVMVLGGVTVTVLGLKMLAPESGSILDGFQAMIEANRAHTGVWKEAVQASSQAIAQTDTYNRLSVIQPATHTLWPWPAIGFAIVAMSIWYNVLNQFMIQRVLGAKNAYHARMGIVLAGFFKVALPFIIVVPGLILFAKYPEVLTLPWDEVKPEADKGYVHMLQTIVPVGLRGLFLAALFGAIQSTVNSVLNSSSTIITLDFYKRLFRPDATEGQVVRIGIWTTTIVLAISMVLAGFIQNLGGGLFEYIQSLYAFFAPPFAAIFLLGILFKRINAIGATWAVILGFIFGIGLKLYLQLDYPHPGWVEPFLNQSAINWLFCTIVCVTVSLMTSAPPGEKVTDQLTINWGRLNIFGDLGEHWYNSVVTWWLVFVLLIFSLGVAFSGLFLK
ncbi:MAG: sodium/solute symporter [Candidatus Omnitrophica bacterium]|nr:sodium/solute symporter [Candidatus Omnitrophota bacterium]